MRLDKSNYKNHSVPLPHHTTSSSLQALHHPHMGQSRRLYNLDKKLYIDFSNGLFKLGEWFFGNDSTRILAMLRSGSSAGTWAGDRMICLGSYLYANDLPNSILTNEELTELNAKGDSLAFEDTVEDET
ncbi:hypothetical protein BDQ17DRAFT_1431657 [Cyathus striatus]|nr:hypothetical protein BDQ17DRAFT_1439661 [Cyathus striatus]KAF8993476.1 hypothetical protein BDQ17DRAFT_1431657 [Cyathus striatus]